MRNIRNRPFFNCRCCNLESDEPRVMNNLAITPSMAKEMTDRGIAISAQQLPVVENTGDYVIDPVMKREMDMNTAWELSHVTRRKIINGFKNDKKVYG